MKTISIFLLFSMILYSCSSTYIINHTQSDYDKLNQDVQDKEVKVILRNGKAGYIQSICVESDSTFWYKKSESLIKSSTTHHEQDSGSMASDSIQNSEQNVIRKSIATSDIERLEIANRGSGALTGAGYGALTGGAIGALVFITAVATEANSNSERGLVLFAGIVLIGGGLLCGALLGVLTGYAIGGADEYIFTDIEQTN